MFRVSSAVCPFCESRALSKALSGKWQLSRTAATLQKRRPSRTQLSATVKRGPRTPDRPVRKSRNSPFNGMNLTVAPRSVQQQYERSRNPSSEQIRTSRGEKSGAKRDEKDPMRALKMQRALANVSYEKRNRIKKDIEELDSFEDFDFLPAIQESISSQALEGLEDVSPTPIQRLGIPALLGTETRGKKRRGMEKTTEMQQFLLAAETGSGKTLAYLLPVIDAIKRAEATEKVNSEPERRETESEQQSRRRNRLFEIEPPANAEPDPSTARPKAIILLPTAELVDQVGALVKSLSHTVKFRSALLSAHVTGTVIKNRLFTTKGIDVVVTTPHIMHSISESDPNVLARVSHLVVDEADSLLDRSFREVTGGILDRVTPSLQQLILCSATIPRNLDSYLQKRFPDMRRLTTPNLHAIPRRVRLSVVEIDKVPYQGNRDLACAQIIWDLGKENADFEDGEERAQKQVLVFVNEREKAGELATYLKKKGIEAAALSRDSEERKSQLDLISSFTGSKPPPASPNAAAKAEKKSAAAAWADSTAISPGDLPLTAQFQPNFSKPASTSTSADSRAKNIPQVLVTTDIFSRGIDTRLLKDVILYDVPHTSIDFIHRLGRVGRMGRRGRGIVLVGKNDRKDIVKEIREAGFGGRALI